MDDATDLTAAEAAWEACWNAIAYAKWPQPIGSGMERPEVLELLLAVRPSGASDG